MMMRGEREREAMSIYGDGAEKEEDNNKEREGEGGAAPLG